MITMTWHVQYLEGAKDHFVRYPTHEEAIESACRLIDKGCDVYGIGAGSLAISISRAEIARLYAVWVRPKRPFASTES
jgi:hypothetical protein